MNTNRTYRGRASLFAICYLAYCVIYVARLNFTVGAAQLQTTGVLSTAQIGIIGSVFALVYAICKVPAGYLGDRFPAGTLIMTGLLITGLSNIAIGLRLAFLPMAVLWAVNAAGQAMLWGPMVRSLACAFGETRGKRACMYLSTAVGVGSIVGLLLAARCASSLGVAACFLVPGGAAILTALPVRLLLGRQETAPGAQRVPLRTSLGVFRDPSFRRVVLPAVAHGMIKDNLNVFLGVYFVDRFSLNVSAMAGYVFFVPLMALTGRLLYPVFYRVLREENRVSCAGFALTALALLPLPLHGLTAPGAMICLGVVSAMVSMINAQLLSVFPVRFAAAGSASFAASVLDFITYGGAGLGALLFGVLIQHYGYNSMFAVWMAGAMISALTMRRGTAVNGREDLT
ncbi:MAG: MFS transporter [Oscillospiraceae bacterium]|nr:MFS transporter [Oscillospiraceae bacterium]